MNVNKKLRVLCLHGYHQNKDVFRQKTGSFRKPLKKYVDFEFLDAPHLLKDSTVQEESLDRAYILKTSADSSVDGRGWWLKFTQGTQSDGLQESLNVFENFIETNKPFDGIMGFSQGAAFLALVCLLLREKLISSGVRYLIFVAGFKSSIPAHQHFYLCDDKITIPSLHVIGDSDEVISSDRSRELLDIFTNFKVVTHPGGHYVPATKDLKDVYLSFISEFLEQ